MVAEENLANIFCWTWLGVLGPWSGCGLEPCSFLRQERLGWQTSTGRGAGALNYISGNFTVIASRVIFLFLFFYSPVFFLWSTISFKFLICSTVFVLKKPCTVLKYYNTIENLIGKCRN